MMLTRPSHAAHVIVFLCLASSLSAQAPPPPPPCVAPVCWPGKFYKFDVVAQTGQTTTAGPLTGLGTQPSINAGATRSWQEAYRKSLTRALRQVIHFVGVQRYGEAQVLPCSFQPRPDRVSFGSKHLIPK